MIEEEDIPEKEMDFPDEEFEFDSDPPFFFTWDTYELSRIGVLGTQRGLLKGRVKNCGMTE